MLTLKELLPILFLIALIEDIFMLMMELTAILFYSAIHAHLKVGDLVYIKGA